MKSFLTKCSNWLNKINNTLGVHSKFFISFLWLILVLFIIFGCGFILTSIVFFLYVILTVFVWIKDDLLN